MARIGKKEAARILRRVVEKHGPDTVYADRDKKYRPGAGTCRYVNGKGKPLCIVGVALVEEIGVSPALLKYEGAFSTYGHGLYSNGPEIQALLTPKAAEVFQAAQDEQDSDLPWGEAVKTATAGIR